MNDEDFKFEFNGRKFSGYSALTIMLAIYAIQALGWFELGVYLGGLK